MKKTEQACACGKTHVPFQGQLLIDKGAIEQIPSLLAPYATKRAFILADRNTFAAAGERVLSALEKGNIPYALYVLEDAHVVPEEHTVGSVLMHLDHTCDTLIGIGSGVINDVCKLISLTNSWHYMIVATAPSMDGYASESSSMERDGLKISLPTRCADVIVGDIDVLKNAPMHMLRAGLGDMLAKYVSICEWRLSHVINGEYYCERIAANVRAALKKCTDNADGLLERNENAVAAVFEGLVLSGVAMNQAGVSRPASGLEHYISHAWDMRGLAFGTPTDLHGIQCAIGTLMAVRLYENLCAMTPDADAARDYVRAFDLAAWHEQLSAFVGAGAEAMIRLEEKEKKYDVERHRARLEIILREWDTLLQIIREELPASKELEALLKKVGIPTSPEALGIAKEHLPNTLRMTKDIRDKYVFSRLAWDLGVLDTLAESLK